MNIAVTSESLDAIASDYHLNEGISDKEFDRRFHYLCFEWVNSLLSPRSRVLEMGYGEGNITRELLSHGHQVEIVEGSAALVDEARFHFQEKVTVHHSLFSDFQPNERYDAILATNVLEHVDDTAATLTSILRWCRDDTKVIVTVPNAESIHRRLAVLMGIQPSIYTLSPRDHLVGHQRVYDFARLSAEVEQAGFEIRSKNGFLLKVLPNLMLKDLSASVIDALYDISDQMDVSMLADIGVVLVKRG